ncbi:Carbon storage regulator [Symmachiella macrocystis]|uniref:Carbon storage regulator n=1 Tax=Symmachiella macrocystis TaxID=2527985 RepID=A0A5C6BSU1_9PLAN|nr:carbon storage regulator [Symmachiella macrocystis]TWU13949.1 Carbon storage regulator [Symmachiella macrocystis]
MLVLTREVGQKVMINGDIAATVSAIGRDFCDVNISHRDGRLISNVTLRIGMSRQELAHGVWGHLANVAPQKKVRLAFEVPNGVTVVREG